MRPEDFPHGVGKLNFTPEQNSPEQSHCLSHPKVKRILSTEPVNYLRLSVVNNKGDHANF